MYMLFQLGLRDTIAMADWSARAAGEEGREGGREKLESSRDKLRWGMVVARSNGIEGLVREGDRHGGVEDRKKVERERGRRRRRERLSRRKAREDVGSHGEVVAVSKGPTANDTSNRQSQNKAHIARPHKDTSRTYPAVISPPRAADGIVTIFPRQHCRRAPFGLCVSVKSADRSPRPLLQFCVLCFFCRSGKQIL